MEMENIEIQKHLSALGTPLTRLISEALQKTGYEAYTVGGCVRDALLGRRQKDIDIATSASPDEVIAALDVHDLKIDLVGKAFGVLIVRSKVHKTETIEVATFREDTSMGRRPTVRFATIIEDSYRRDLTINAIYYDVINERLIDPHGGRADLDRGIIRTPGVPAQRLAEDVLRALRAVRFAAVNGFMLDLALEDAIRSMANLYGIIDHNDDGPVFGRIPQERIVEEFTKGIAGCKQKPQHYLLLLKELGLLDEMFKGANIDNIYKFSCRGQDDSVDHTVGVLFDMDSDRIRNAGFPNSASNKADDIQNMISILKGDYSAGHKPIRDLRIPDWEVSEYLSEWIDRETTMYELRRITALGLIGNMEKVDGNDVMAETGLKSKALGEEIIRREKTAFDKALSANDFVFVENSPPGELRKALSLAGFLVGGASSNSQAVDLLQKYLPWEE